MHVASLELCCELHKLSGWKLSGSNFMSWVEYADESSALWAGNAPEHWDEVISSCPAYDLGYLLRKLPERLQTVDRFQGYLNVWKGARGWYVSYMEEGEVVEVEWLRAEVVADTPEDAAAKLCIELFKQGVLKKGDSPADMAGSE